MRKHSIHLLLAFFALFAVAPAAFALRTDDTTVFFPVVGRFPGVGGTQWRTDVFLANHNSVAKSVAMTFHVAGALPITRTVAIGPFSTESFRDIVLTMFGLTAAAGELQLVSSNESGFEARARIFNAGNPAGEFGQSVPAVGRAWLRSQAYIYGLSGISGSRVNIGVTNPNDTPVTVTMRIANKTNATLHVQSLTLQPHQNMQFNDIFGRFGIPLQDNVQVVFSTTELPIYGYASEVRDDTGDAVFTLGTSPNA